MHVFDLAAVAEDRRVARERDGHRERAVRRLGRIRPEPAARKSQYPVPAARPAPRGL